MCRDLCWLKGAGVRRVGVRRVGVRRVGVRRVGYIAGGRTPPLKV